MTFSQKYLKALREEIADKVDSVGRGSCATIQEYAGACGEILGLRTAEQAFLELLKTTGEETDGEEIPVA